MQQVLLAFAGPGRTVLSFAPTYSMYPEYARDTHSTWVAGRRADDFTIDVAQRVRRSPSTGPSVVLLASPNNPTGTALAAGRHRGAARGRTGHGRRRRGVRRVPPRRHAERAVAAAARTRAWSSPAPCPRRSRSPADGSATWPPRPPSSTRCASCGCRTTCPRSRRRSPGSRWRTPTSCSRAVDELRAERDRTVDWLRVDRAAGRGLRRQLRAVRDVRRPARRLAGPARPRRADPGDWAGRLAARVDRHARGDGRVPTALEEVLGHERHGRRPHRPHRPHDQAETKVLVEIDLDGVGRTDVSTGVGFYDHMLVLVRQARPVRPHRAGRGRSAHRRPPHRRGHRDRARPGVRAGRRRQGRHAPLRRRD